MDKEFIKSYSSIVWEGIRTIAGLPHNIKLRFNRVIKKNKNAKIYLEYWQAHYKKWLECLIAVDLEKEEIDWDRTSEFLFDRDYKGSGMIGVMLFSAPVWFPLLPVLMLINKFYKAKERQDGVCRHSQKILEALEGELDIETEAALHAAMKKEYELKNYLQQRVSFEKAKEILSQCKLVEQCATDQGVCIYEFSWFDADSNRIAMATFFDHQLDDVLRIFDSTFDGEKAYELLKCFKEREVVDYDKKREERKKPSKRYPFSPIFKKED